MQASGQTGANLMSPPATVASVDNASKQAGVRKPYTITKQRERWTDDEHARFLEALRLHGRTWRKIEEHIGTKSAVQIRSHAQKFFSKVERKRDTGCSNGAGVEEPGIGDPFSIPPPRPKRKPSRLDSGKGDQLLGGGFQQDYDDCNDDESNNMPQQLQQQHASHQHPLQHLSQQAPHHTLTLQHQNSLQQQNQASQQTLNHNGREAVLPAPVRHHVPSTVAMSGDEEALTRQQHAHLTNMMMHAAQQHMLNLHQQQQQLQPNHHHNPHREQHPLQHSGYDAAMLHHQQQQHHLHHPSREQHTGAHPAQANHTSQLPPQQQQMAHHTAIEQVSEVNEATVAMVAAAASAAAAAAAAAVVAAAGLQVQAHLQAHPPAGFPFFGVPPSLLAQVTLANPALEVFSSGYGGVLQQFLTGSEDQPALSTRDQAPSVRGQQQQTGQQQRTGTLAEATATSDIGDLSLDLPNSRDSDGDSGNATSRKNDSWGRGSSLQQHSHGHQQQQVSQQLSQQQHGMSAFMAANASSEAWAGLSRPLGGTLPSAPSLWDLLPPGAPSGPTPEASNDAHFRQLLFAGMQQANAGSWNAGQGDRPIGFGRTGSSNDGSGRRLSQQPWPDLISQGTDNPLKSLREDCFGTGLTGVSNGWDGANQAAMVQAPPPVRQGDSPGHAESHHQGQQSPSPPPQDVATDTPMAPLQLNPSQPAGAPHIAHVRANSDDTDRRDSNIVPAQRHPVGQPPVKKQKSQATGNDAALSAREAQASNLNHKSAGHTNPSTNNQGSNRSPDHGSPTDAGGGGGSCEMGSDGSNSCGNGSCRRHHEGRNTKQGDVGGSGHAGSQNHHRGGIIEHKGTTGHRGQQTEAAASVRDSNGSAGDGVSGNLPPARGLTGIVNNHSHQSHHAPHGTTHAAPASAHTHAHGSRNGYGTHHHARQHGHTHSNHTNNTVSASPSLYTNGSTHGSNNNVRAQQSAAGPAPVDLSTASRHNYSNNQQQQVHTSSRLQVSLHGSGSADGGLPRSNSSAAAHAAAQGDAARCSSDDNSLLQLLNNSDMLTCMRDGSLQAMMDAMNARQGIAHKQLKQQQQQQDQQQQQLDLQNPHPMQPAEQRPSSIHVSNGSRPSNPAASGSLHAHPNVTRVQSMEGVHIREPLSIHAQQQQQAAAQLEMQQQAAVLQQQQQQHQTALQQQQQQQENHAALLRAAVIHEYNTTLMQQQQHVSLSARPAAATTHNAPQQLKQEGGSGLTTSSGCHSVLAPAGSFQQLKQHQTLAQSPGGIMPPGHAYTSPPSFHTNSGVSSFSCGAVAGGGSGRVGARTSFDTEPSSLQQAAGASAGVIAHLPFTYSSRKPAIGLQNLTEQGARVSDASGCMQVGAAAADGSVTVPAAGMVKSGSLLKLLEAASNSQEGSLLRLAVVGGILA